jgi:hypothetical protein
MLRVQDYVIHTLMCKEKLWLMSKKLLTVVGLFLEWWSESIHISVCTLNIIDRDVSYRASCMG